MKYTGDSSSKAPDTTGGMSSSGNVPLDDFGHIIQRVCPYPHDPCPTVKGSPTVKGVPYCCPVCGGCGTVPTRYYGGRDYGSSTVAQEQPCRACGGTGIVWGGA